MEDAAGPERKRKELACILVNTRSIKLHFDETRKLRRNAGETTVGCPVREATYVQMKGHLYAANLLYGDPNPVIVSRFMRLGLACRFILLVVRKLRFPGRNIRALSQIYTR